MYFIIALIIIIAALMVRRYGVLVIRVEGPSMQPALHDKQLVFARRTHKNMVLKKGDIVVVDSVELGRSIIKRIVGLPGETIMVEGKTYNIPAGQYFLLGDNLDYSSDSRKWQSPYISKRLIEGKVGQVKQWQLYDVSGTQK